MGPWLQSVRFVFLRPCCSSHLIVPREQGRERLILELARTVHDWIDIRSWSTLKRRG
jgi:hypothetical protein